ncbi:MAG: helix-turn-helix transcriptional regulator, partial [Candidatus Sumerlaeia bacterium]|nr:helix-turn-helix transcriptional regulator [Candidatus Sumerlaeia bacterium]
YGSCSDKSFDLAMKNLRQELANKLKALRGDKSQRDFAEEIGIPKSTLQRLERCEQNVGIDTLQALCSHFKCGIADLFDS